MPQDEPPIHFIDVYGDHALLEQLKLHQRMHDEIQAQVRNTTGLDDIAELKEPEPRNLRHPLVAELEALKQLRDALSTEALEIKSPEITAAVTDELVAVRKRIAEIETYLKR